MENLVSLGTEGNQQLFHWLARGEERSGKTELPEPSCNQGQKHSGETHSPIPSTQNAHPTLALV